MEEGKTSELNSISIKFFAQIMTLLNTIFSSLSSLSSHPLFSAIVTLYTLILFYFSSLFLEIIFSPVILLTGIILFTLLRLGAIQIRNQTLPNSANEILPEKEIVSDSIELRNQKSTAEDQKQKWSPCQKLVEFEPYIDLGLGMDPSPTPFFYTWDVRAPLDVIYEEYEGEEQDGEEEEEEDYGVYKEKRVSGIERYPSLSMYFSDIDCDSLSDFNFSVMGEWDSSERATCFRWEEEDKDGLIEIALDVNTTSNDVFLAEEEDSLIEIDLSPGKHDEFSGEGLYTVNLH